MPDRQHDVDKPPIVLPNSGQSVPLPATTRVYQSRLSNPKTGNGSSLGDLSAELLYMIVSVGSPESLQQFSHSEIGDVNENGLPEFLDGWGRPIAFVRWAPGFSPAGASLSDIQVRDAVNHHDPFDNQSADPNAWHLIPLIYSAGSDGKLGLENSGPKSSTDEGYYFAKDTKDVNLSGKTENMFTNTDGFMPIGQPTAAEGSLTDFQDNITNHHIEVR
jgi:hypothetical protein